MNALSRLIDRARLRNAPPQVQEGYELYRDPTYGGMVIGNAFHALPHHQEIRGLLRAMRTTDRTDTERLDQLLREIRTHHAEFKRIRELERPITPWGSAAVVPEKQRRRRRGPITDPTAASRPQTSAPVAADAQGGRLIRSRFPAGHDALR
jgi:hypothetical protein